MTDNEFAAEAETFCSARASACWTMYDDVAEFVLFSEAGSWLLSMVVNIDARLVPSMLGVELELEASACINGSALGSVLPSALESLEPLLACM